MTPKTIDTKAVAIREDYALSPQAEAERARFLPVMSMPMALERRNTVLTAIQKLMREGEDYGAIPGAGQKKCLLQPGAQKLDNIFGLVPTYQVVDKDLDWTGERHGGEAFFHYEVRCVLMRGDFQMGEGLGQCSSWESKYRWRKSERMCPKCQQENIRKSKDGGWYCWQKTGGCGATFKAGDATIEGQQTGRKPNPDIHDQVNTILKMAEKRAHLLATINATSASEFLTQDVVDEGTYTQETAAQVADRRIAEEQGRLDRQRAQPEARTDTQPPVTDGTEGFNIEPEVRELWEKMGSAAKPIIEMFSFMKAQLSDAMGASAGEATYRSVLASEGGRKNKAEFVRGETASVNAARRAVRKLWLALQDAKALGVSEEDLSAYREKPDAS